MLEEIQILNFLELLFTLKMENTELCLFFRENTNHVEKSVFIYMPQLERCSSNPFYCSDHKIYLSDHKIL